MNIRYQTWRRFTRIGSILAVPAALVLVFRAHVSHALELAAIVFIFLLGGIGALLAILTRAGIVQMIYSEADKQSMDYRMSKTVAKMEQSQERGYSESYYENLGVKPPKQKEPDDKPAA